jgi:flavin reductase (DIM6/NTAB) family NADH-FMN oxidoreductase RutF
VLSALVTPRPIAWVTSIDASGVVNVAPFSFFNVLGAKLPIVGFCPGDRDDGTPKDTALNVRMSHEFVVNLVDEDVAQAMNLTAASLKNRRIPHRIHQWKKSSHRRDQRSHEFHIKSSTAEPPQGNK